MNLPSRALPPLLLPCLLTLLAACTTDKSDDTDTDTGTPSEDGGSGSYGIDSAATSGDGGGSDDGGSSDGGSSDGGSGDGGSGDGGGDELCQTEWHPVHLAGWTKTFDAVYNDEAGTAEEQGFGPGTDDNGTLVYKYRDAVSTPAGGYDAEVMVGCDYDGEGMFLLQWDADYEYNLFGFPIPGQAIGYLNPYRKYLPPEWATGSVGSWTYDYTILVQEIADSGTGTTQNWAVSGTYTEVGSEDLELFDGTVVSAYKLTNSYTLTKDFETTEGYIEQWWARGLGLVKELNKSTTDGTTLGSKELTGYSGLTPVQ